MTPAGSIPVDGIHYEVYNVESMPPNTNAALIGYAMVGIEAVGLTRLVHELSLGRLGYLFGIIFVVASFIGWFYWMHLYGLYEQTEGEHCID